MRGRMKEAGDTGMRRPGNALERRWLVAVATLPLPVVLLIPAGLVLLCRGRRWTHTLQTPSDVPFWVGMEALQEEIVQEVAEGLA